MSESWRCQIKVDVLVERCDTHRSDIEQPLAGVNGTGDTTQVGRLMDEIDKCSVNIAWTYALDAAVREHCAPWFDRVDGRVDGEAADGVDVMMGMIPSRRPKSVR